MWRDRYHLLDPVADSATSFHGRESASSEPVLIHMEPSRTTLIELMALPPAAYSHVREFGQDADGSYVVTDMHFGAAELPAWLKRARAERVEEPVAVAMPGEFTKLWGSALAPPPAIPKIEHAGEITTLFQRKSETVVAPAVTLEPPPEPEPPQPLPPGDFTRLLGAPVSKPTAEIPLPPPPPAKTTTGDYTRIVMTRPSAPTPTPSAPPPASKPPRRDLRPIIVFAALALLALVLILLAAFGR